ncbi:MAG TPA: J domain-containing protein [Rhodocyclaceae bacterium]|nr:J domain-containing protein [Rhodocyclaceae bacterium]
MKTAANNFYDLLEVNRSASLEAISAAYQRLRAKLTDMVGGPDEDATNQLIALREAYSTLSDPERRRRYDDRLALRESEPVPIPAQSRSFLAIAVLAILLGVGWLSYSKYQTTQEKARLERERIAAETRAAELALQKEKEDREALQEEERQRFQNETIERINRERDIAYGNQVSRNLQYAEQQAMRDKQREAQRAAQQQALEERQRVQEAERQLAKDKAYLRQLQAENRGYRGY